jgi:hypothetical protein
VLRQIGVLPNSLYCKANASETTLPVMGPRVVDRLKEPYNTVNGDKREREVLEQNGGLSL